MPQLGDSHKNYILDPKHRKTTNIKYEVTRLFVEENLKNKDSILELFGGVGITTRIIRDTIKPLNHFIVEIADDSFAELERKFPDYEISKFKTDAFTFDWGIYPIQFDWIFIDSTFKMSIKNNFNHIFELLKRDSKSNVFFTESEIFKLLFIKQERREEERTKHFNKLIEMFKSYNLNTKKIYYCSSNSYLVLIREPVDSTEIVEVKDGTDFWKRYL